MTYIGLGVRLLLVGLKVDTLDITFTAFMLNIFAFILSIAIDISILLWLWGKI